MDKILVTGAGGFFASRFCKYYSDRYEIIPLKRNDLDIRDENKVLNIIKDIRPNYVLHTAAIADTGKCEQDKATSYDINVLGSRNIAKGCSLVNAKLIHLSTEQLFNGNIEKGPYNEEVKPEPNTTYGNQKLMAEEEIRKVLEEAYILRLTWMFGFPERFEKVNANIVWNVMKAALSGSIMRIPINEYRGMTYVYDLINNIPKIINLPYGIYHTGSENNLSTYDIAKHVAEELGLSYRINDIIEKDEEKFKELPRDLRISNAKLKSFGIEFLDTEEAVSRCIKEFDYRV